jgi:hypothetical protein
MASILIRRLSSMPIPIRFGLFGILFWLLFLSWAFLESPTLDNLAVTFPIWTLQGLPGLERVQGSALYFGTIVFFDGLAVFASFAALGVAFLGLKRFIGRIHSGRHQ